MTGGGGEEVVTGLPRSSFTWKVSQWELLVGQALRYRLDLLSCGACIGCSPSKLARK